MRRSVVRARPLTEREMLEVERENSVGDEAGCTKGFCAQCESFVDEQAGRLHRATCSAVAPERRKAS